MSNTTADDLRAHLKAKRNELDALIKKDLELATLMQGQVRILKEQVAKIPQIENQIAALETTIFILEGEKPTIRAAVGRTITPAPTAEPSQRNIVFKVGRTAADLAEAALREAGKPLTASELMGIVKAWDPTVKEPTLTSALYVWAKKEKRFTLPAPGKFGLKEWETS